MQARKAVGDKADPGGQRCGLRQRHAAKIDIKRVRPKCQYSSRHGCVLGRQADRRGLKPAKCCVTCKQIQRKTDKRCGPIKPSAGQSKAFRQRRASRHPQRHPSADIAGGHILSRRCKRKVAQSLARAAQDGKGDHLKPLCLWVQSQGNPVPVWRGQRTHRGRGGQRVQGRKGCAQARLKRGDLGKGGGQPLSLGTGQKRKIAVGDGRCRQGQALRLAA